MVRTARNGISHAGVRVFTLIRSPRYPFWKVSRTIMCRKYIGNVFWLIKRNRLRSFGYLFWNLVAETFRSSKNMAVEITIMFAVSGSAKKKLFAPPMVSWIKYVPIRV